jgi:hypothetical protein
MKTAKKYDIEKLKDWSKFGLTFSNDLQYVHKITAISETFNLLKKTTKYFNAKLTLKISKNNCIYYKGKATEEFFTAWKQDKNKLKSEGWGLVRDTAYSSPTYKGGIHIKPNGQSWYIIKYLT